MRSTKMRNHGSCRAAALLVVGALAALAACGSSGRPRGTAASGSPALAYVQCLRSHGVPNFPDPGPGRPLVIPSSINAASPAFQGAEKACARLMPGGGSGSGSGAGSRTLELLAIAKCMREHGVPNFPDPASSPPPPSDGNAIGGNGVYLSVGPPGGGQSPAFKRAAKTCRLP